MELMILCRVVDNFGDAGVVLRLCRSIWEISRNLKINLVTNSVETLEKICGGKKSLEKICIQRGWKIFGWDREICSETFAENPPEKILECFQCGRPDWLEKILFDPAFKKNVQILNVEYLTAEDWAEEFHLLKSGTRSAFVKKTNFLPGFTEKTGGLILDENFLHCVNDKNFARNLARKKIGFDENCFNILLFSYDVNLDFFFDAAEEFSREKKICVFVAQGAGLESAGKSAAKKNFSFSVKILPFLQQEIWDAFLCCADFAFVRGEDSFSRACAAGVPFVWNIYPQDDEFHFVKLNAFLKKLGAAEAERFSFLYNFRRGKKIGMEAAEILNEKKIDFPRDEKKLQQELKTEFLFLLRNSSELKKKFAEFSQKIISNGNMTKKILDFFAER